jgi:hypothetical protein
MTAPQIDKGRVHDPRCDDRNYADERGPPELFRPREDDGENVGAEFERILPGSLYSGEGSPMIGFNVLCSTDRSVWMPDQGNRARASCATGQKEAQ